MWRHDEGGRVKKKGGWFVINAKTKEREEGKGYTHTHTQRTENTCVHLFVFYLYYYYVKYNRIIHTRPTRPRPSLWGPQRKREGCGCHPKIYTFRFGCVIYLSVYWTSGRLGEEKKGRRKAMRREGGRLYVYAWLLYIIAEIETPS